MRASATSRTNSPANIPPSQAKADANKADAASPFALLVEMASAKDPAKPSKKDAKDSGDQPANDKPAIKQNDGNRNGARQDDNADAAQTAPRPAASLKPGKPDKSDSDKSDKDDEAAKIADTVQSAPDDQQVAAVEQQIQMLDQQPLIPVMQASIAASTGPSADVEDDMQIDEAAPAAKAATPPSGMDMSQPEPLNRNLEAGKSETGETAPTQAAPQTQASAQPDPADDTETSDTVAAASAAARTAQADAKPPATPKETGKPAAVKTASRSETSATAKPENADVERITGDPAASAKDAKDGDEPVGNLPAKTVKTDTAKDDNLNIVALKGHAAHTGVANAPKADTDTSGGQKSDAPQADSRPADSDAAAAPAAAKPMPQSASMSNAGFAINTIAAPQAAQHSQAPVAIQHVQVTAEAAPNLPALAVEIAAKSQSGAKQFDIRLDPPELGRVEVRLSIDSTGKASAHLSADQPQTLALLQKDAPILTRALREAGLDVSQDGLNFSLRHQSGGQGGNDGNHGRFGSSRSFSLTATASIDPAATAAAYRGVVDGRLDIRV